MPGDGGFLIGLGGLHPLAHWLWKKVGLGGLLAAGCNRWRCGAVLQREAGPAGLPAAALTGGDLQAQPRQSHGRLESQALTTSRGTDRRRAAISMKHRRTFKAGVKVRPGGAERRGPEPQGTLRSLPWTVERTVEEKTNRLRKPVPPFTTAPCSRSPNRKFAAYSPPTQLARPRGSYERGFIHLTCAPNLGAPLRFQADHGGRSAWLINMARDYSPAPASSHKSAIAQEPI